MSTTDTEIPLREAAIVLRPEDDVAIATRRLPAGAALRAEQGALIISHDVPAGHKIALRAVHPGSPVHKYGQIIGYATDEIRPGDWIHSHNVGFGLGEGDGPGKLRLDIRLASEARPVEMVPPDQRRTFPGYLRADGRVGTRNYVAVISSVNCSASASRAIARAFDCPAFQRDHPGVDGVIALTHKSGCGQQMGSLDYQVLQRTLAGFANHPNVAGYLLVGLGCEVNQTRAMAENGGLIRPDAIGSGRPELPPILVIQEAGGVRKSVNAGIEQVEKLLVRAAGSRRTEQGISSLLVGTNCGGSDGSSGITANPALGLAGDEFVRQGAGWVLAETTETYGAEHLLANRAVTAEVGQKLLDLMRWWEWYAGVWDASIDGNPTPGNKAGGLTTIYEKSLGAAAKAGSTPLVEVYRYAERITSHGLTFMDTPGHDPVSVTGLVAGGCNLVAFTTGRGSCLGFRPSPVLKIATNSPLYERMESDMDVDAGVVLRGVPVADVGRQIFEELIQVAGGKQTKSESQGLGEDEFAPWQLGPVL